MNELSLDFDLLEATLLIHNEQEHKIALGNIRLLADKFLFHPSFQKKSLSWIVSTWNHCFQLEDLDWCHFLLFSMLLSVDKVQSAFRLSTPLQKFKIFIDYLERYTIAFIKGYPMDDSKQSFKAADVQSDVRSFVWHLRTYYLTL